MSQKKLKVKEELRLMIPRLASEANQLKDAEARSRWMKIRKIALSPKSIETSCSHEGVSVDFFSKWANRLIKSRRLRSLFTRSRKPKRSPSKTKPRVEKKVLSIRRVEPYLGPLRIADTAAKIYNILVPSSTVFNILKRAGVVSKKIAEKLTKRHLKRYRRPFCGYLQMDFKYVPYKVEGRQYYQLSCVDHHSSWRLIRCYRNKDLPSVLMFLAELLRECPFYIMEIQTDNDAAFTDKFSSQGRGVTGQHAMDLWCAENRITHRLIPVGVKELNGKVENTHKQDDREFYAMGNFENYESIATNTKGYNDRWNATRATRALGKKTPNEAVYGAYVKAVALMMFIANESNQAIYRIDKNGNIYLPIPTPKKLLKPKIKTRKISAVDKYLQYLDWDEKNKLKALIVGNPTMSQIFSLHIFSLHIFPEYRESEAFEPEARR